MRALPHAQARGEALRGRFHRTRHADRRHDLHGPRSPCQPGSERLQAPARPRRQEDRVVPLHRQGREIRLHRRARPDRECGAPHPDLQDAARARGSRPQDRGLLPLHRERGRGADTQVPVEREDALREDFRCLRACARHGLLARPRPYLQARRSGGVGGGPDHPRGLRGLAVHQPTERAGQAEHRPAVRGRRQVAAHRVLRQLPGLPRARSRRAHQTPARVGTRGGLGPGHLRRVPLRGLERELQDTLRAGGRGRGEHPGGHRYPRRAREHG